MKIRVLSLLTLLVLLFGTFGTAGADMALVVDGGWTSFQWGSGQPTWINQGVLTFTSAGPVEVKVTDGYINGDQFRVFDGGVPLGETSAPGSGSCGSNPDTCFADPNASSGTFPLGPGSHSITIEVILNPYNGGGAWIRVDSVESPEEPMSVDRITGQFVRTRQGIQLKSFVYVKDEGGAPLEGVEVTAALDVPGVGSGIVKTATTDADGRATFKVLSTKPRGTWQLCVTVMDLEGYTYSGPDCQTWAY